MEANDERVIVAIHKGLVEFGYTGLPIADVRESVARCMAGTTDRTNVIDMFVRDQLEAAGLVK